MGSLIFYLWYPFDDSASPVYMVFPLPRCRLDMLLPLLCTCHTYVYHCKKYYCWDHASSPKVLQKGNNFS
jgi:hypothetical protein